MHRHCPLASTADPDESHESRPKYRAACQEKESSLSAPSCHDTTQKQSAKPSSPDRAPRHLPLVPPPPQLRPPTNSLKSLRNSKSWNQPPTPISFSSSRL